MRHVDDHTHAPGLKDHLVQHHVDLVPLADVVEVYRSADVQPGQRLCIELPGRVGKVHHDTVCAGNVKDYLLRIALDRDNGVLDAVRIDVK